MNTICSLLVILAVAIIGCHQSHARVLQNAASPHRRLDSLAGLSMGSHKNTRSVDSSGHYTLDSIGGNNILSKYLEYLKGIKMAPYFWDHEANVNVAPPLYPPEYEYRTIDSIGGGNILDRTVDTIGGGNILGRSSVGGGNVQERTVDSIGGGNILGLRYGKRMDSLSGMSLGTSKRTYGDLEHDVLEEIDRQSSS